MVELISVGNFESLFSLGVSIIIGLNHDDSVIIRHFHKQFLNNGMSLLLETIIASES